jgi:hypothetical protein
MDYKLNLNSFIDKCNISNIKFMYFYTENINEPIICNSFKQLTYDTNKIAYIRDGTTESFIYIYSKSSLKYIVSSPLKPIEGKHQFQATIKSKSKKGDVYLGNHLTFGFIKSKNENKYRITSHKTIYKEQKDLKFKKEIKKYMCNFYNINSNLTNYRKFLDNECYANLADYDNNKNSGTIGTNYNDDDDKKIIYKLCNVLEGNIYVGGVPKEYIKINKKKFLVKTGKLGGKYIMKNNKKQYILKGGNNINYKGITFITPTFSEYIKQKIIIPVKNRRQDLEIVEIIFDEMNELVEDANMYINFLYDFTDNTRNVFSIETQTLLISCYASDQIYTKNIPKEELELNELVTLTKFEDFIKAILSQIAAY